jgi:hypothetical protein
VLLTERSSRVLRFALLFVLGTAVVEGSAALALRVLMKLRPTRFAVAAEHFATQVARVDAARLRKRIAEDTYDAALGWRNAPNSMRDPVNSAGSVWMIHYDAEGARRDGAASGDPRVAAFGDSFTQCDEVGDDQTWEHDLATATGVRVLNFGVGGYGPDQAILLVERKLEAGLRTPIIILGIHEENVNRAVNRYRPYYAPFDPMQFAFKPRFILGDDGLELLANPLILDGSTPTPIAAYVAEAARDDYWYAYNAQRPRFAFPFSYQLAKLALDVSVEKSILAVNPLAPLRNDLWHDPAAQDLLTALVRRFASHVSEAGLTPVLLLIPEVGDATRWKDHVPGYRAWLDRLRAAIPESKLPIVDVAGAITDPARFRVRPDGGHASVDGNRTIAAALLPVLLPLLDQGDAR